MVCLMLAFALRLLYLALISRRPLADLLEVVWLCAVAMVAFEAVAVLFDAVSE